MFQYHTGPIKRGLPALVEGGRGFLCFNTTLVQLKGLRQPPRGEYHVQFQYHTGPIKRHELAKQRKLIKRVSIPHWSN